MQLSTQDLTELPAALSSVCMTAVVAYMSHNHQAVIIIIILALCSRTIMFVVWEVIKIFSEKQTDTHS